MKSIEKFLLYTHLFTYSLLHTRSIANALD